MNKIYKRWLILAASIIVNICIGGGYAWSVYTEPLSKIFGCNSSQLALAFAINMGIAPLPMLISSRIQQLKGSKFTIICGGIIAGLGFFTSSFAQNLPMLYITYGVITGFGSNVAYSAVLSNTAKFFPDKRGLALGLALGGYGAGSMIMAPFASLLIRNIGVLNTFKIIGTIIFALTCLCSILIANAPENFLPENFEKASPGKKENCTADTDLHWKSMLLNLKFYVIFFMFGSGIFTGLMITSSASPIGQSMYKLSSGAAALAVSTLAICNGLGRIIGGWLIDRFGPINIIRSVYIISSIMLMGLINLKLPVAFTIAVIGIGLCYGACIATTPVFVTENFGVKGFATNYGIMFIAYSAASFLAPRVAAIIKMSNNGDYTKAFYIGIAVAIAGLLTTYIFQILNKVKKRNKLTTKNKIFLNIK